MGADSLGLIVRGGGGEGEKNSIIISFNSNLLSLFKVTENKKSRKRLVFGELHYPVTIYSVDE